MLVSIQENGIKFNKETNAFKLDGRKVAFATQYILMNDKTKESQAFNFSHSTGSEWDPNTVWVYKTQDELLTLEVSNYVPSGAKEAYLEAKISNYYR